MIDGSEFSSIFFKQVGMTPASRMRTLYTRR
jgi:AraC-like DNA-binding protein